MRGTRGLLLAGILVHLAAGGLPPAAAGDPPDGESLPAGPARTPEFQEKVDLAISRGALWLKGSAGGDSDDDVGKGAFNASELGFPLGMASIRVLTLRSCGVPAADPVVQSGLQRMRSLWKAGRGHQTYEVSLALLALEAHHTPPPKPGAKERPGKPSPGPRSIPAADLDWIRAMTSWLVSAQNNSGSFGYFSPPSRGGDLSNTQYALLGLKAARRCGVEVPKSVFRKAAEFTLSCQERVGPKVLRREGPDGKGREGGRSAVAVQDTARGFGYSGAGGSSGSMTSAGVSTLVICRGEIRGTSVATEKTDDVLVRGIRDGIAWLGHNFSVTGNPYGRGSESSLWHFYYLYGLERAGVLAGVAWMGNRDWYGEGAAFLVRDQEGNGSWDAGGGMSGRRGGAGRARGEVLDTCFALLFLKKATFRVEGAVATEEADEELDLSGAASLDDDSFRAVFDTVFARFARATEEARGTLAGDFLRLGTRALPLLIRLLEEEETPRRAAAIDALRRVTGETQGFAADAPVEARADAVAAWETWWFARRSGLVVDSGAGRFR